MTDQEKIEKIKERISKVNNELFQLQKEYEANKESDFVDEDYYTGDISMKEMEINLLVWILTDVFGVKA